MSTKPMVNRKKGEYSIHIGGKWIVLKANFSNIALFEDNVTGIYEFANRVGQGDVKMTGVVNLIYCFQKDRETDKGLSQDDIMELVISDEPKRSIEAITGFMGVLFAIEDMDKVLEEQKELDQTVDKKK